MKSMSMTLVVAAWLFSVGTTDAAPPKKNDALGAAFTKLKAMSGEWAVTGDGKDLPPNAKITYRVTGGGSVVMETLFPGTPMEMVSMYHRDGKKLVMTHYCMAKNQPRFRARIDKKTGELVFHFAGGSNLDTKKDMHVHGGRFRFVDADNVVSRWTYWIAGKEEGTTEFRLKRVK